MKKILSFTLILVAFISLPFLAHAAATGSTQTATTQTPTVEPIDINSPVLQGKSLTAKKAVVQASFQDIVSRLNNLSDQTQLAINQLTLNHLDTTEAQTDLMFANVSLTKAKNDIAAFATITVSPKVSNTITLENLKNAANTAENSLEESKKHLIDSLVSLKTLLPGLDTASQ